MSNEFNSSETSHHLKFSRDQGFFDRSLGVRIFLGIAFGLFLFCSLHFREVRVPVLELGSKAQNYLVAQVDFEFLDDEATIILKQKASRDLGKIYRISEKDIRQKRLEFENVLVFKQDWRQQVEDSNFEEMYRGAEELETVLKKIRLSDPRTIQKLKDVGLDYSSYEIYTPPNIQDPITFSHRLWRNFKVRAFGETTLSEGAVNFIMNYFKNLNWKLEEDRSAFLGLKKRVEGEIPDRYTKIQAGSRIIDQGEKITGRHIIMLKAMKRSLSESRNLWHPLTLLGSLLMTLCIIIVGALYLKANYPDVIESNRRLLILLTVFVLTIVLAKIFEFLVTTSTTNFADFVRYPLFAPFSAILLSSLLTPGLAAFVSGCVIVLLQMILAIDLNGFLVTNVAAGIVTVLSTPSLRRRKEVLIVCGQAWLACAAVILSLHLYEGRNIGFSLVADLSSSFVFMFLTAILVVGLLPLLETAFQVVTDVTLMEYMDPNHELLRRLSIQAPGTYQHSVVVGNLAEAAALAIGANGLFCRVAALYHDIGKMVTPQYFTENQQGGMNIHQLLTPIESAEVIISHVSEGVAMARKAGLPEQFIDIIKEHHGTTLVYFFYRKQLELENGDESKIDDRNFRYSGPKPRSRESAIIMIADTLEAASRALEDVSEEKLSKLVESLVREKEESGQFDECLLTFEELGIVKKELVKALLASGHGRIKYPERLKKHNEASRGA